MSDLDSESDALDPQDDGEEQGPAAGERIVSVSGMFRDYFLDYASYVILERAVPLINDGLKPVQRRLLHSMRELEDGRYNKVANIIGNTMKYHPHGDASIGDALVQLGQKDLLVDTQGNWGNVLTGDGSAAPRYIEARLSKFALHVAFSPKITHWHNSYDGRNQEPVSLPIKFPILLAQGAEGIAVGLSCKFLPHNFLELIDASIAHLKGKSFTLYPDFITGGMVDVSSYNKGARGSRVKVRAKLSVIDNKTLLVSEIPYGTTTSSLIDSILKANDRGKIKIKKVEDNTSENVEIIIHLAPGVSPDKSIDALYAFSDCEVSLSPNACLIEGESPLFTDVHDILRKNTDHTLDMLRAELEIKKKELQEQWHYASLEKIFIEKRIYRDIEECETWEAIIEAIHLGLKPHIAHLHRGVTDEDVAKLTEIKIKRISKFDSKKADEFISRLEGDLEQVQHHLDNIIDFSIDYFKNLKEKFGKGRERKTEIKEFDTIIAAKVAVANVKLYVDRAEGFIGMALKKSESDFVADCSDIDDVIVIRGDGTMMVTRISPKAFVGKNILHVGVWKKGDKRTIYNLIYRDGKSGPAMMKRFSVTSITRDKEYPVTKGSPGSQILYLSCNPNGEAETVSVLLVPRPNLKRLKLEMDFSELGIKGRGAGGNILTKHAVKKVELKEKGISTLGAREIWYDEAVNRINSEGRGVSFGRFSGQDRILAISSKGYYRLHGFDLSTHFDEDLLVLEKWNPKKPISAIYYDSAKEQFFVKRFLLEMAPSSKQVFFIPEEEGTQLEMVTSDWLPQIELVFAKIKGKQRDNEILNLEEFIGIKGLKAQGNRLSSYQVKDIKILESLPFETSENLVVEDGDTEEDNQPYNESEQEGDNDNTSESISSTTAEDSSITEVSDTIKKPSSNAIKPKNKKPTSEKGPDGQATLF